MCAPIKSDQIQVVKLNDPHNVSVSRSVRALKKINLTATNQGCVLLVFMASPSPCTIVIAFSKSLIMLGKKKKSN